MKRWGRFTLAATGLASALLLSACAGGPGSHEVTLKLVAADYGSSPQTSSKRYWDRVARDFTEQNPDIKVDVKIVSWNTIDKEVAEIIKSGDHPDLLQTSSYADFAARDMLYSADELLSIPVQADFITSLANAGQVNWVQYGIPFVSSSRLMFYNMELFEKAGITTGPPKTWGDVKRYALKLKAAGVEVPYGMPLGPEEAQAETLLWFMGGEGGFTDLTGSYHLDTQENIDTFTWVRNNLIDTGLTNPHPAKTDRQKVFELFLEGKVGMLNGHPTLITQAKKAGIDYGLVSIPGQNRSLEETLGVADWMMAFKKNGNRDAIGKFLAFAYNKENALDFLEQYDLLPVTASASEEMLADPSKQDIWPFLDKLPSAEFYPLGDPAWTEINAKLRKDLGKAITGDPAKVLKDLQIFAKQASAARS